MKDMKELPVVKPLLALFKSRKFTLALSVILGSFIVLKIPGLTEYKELIIAMFVVLFSVVAGPSRLRMSQRSMLEHLPPQMKP